MKIRLVRLLTFAWTLTVFNTSQVLIFYAALRYWPDAAASGAFVYSIFPGILLSYVITVFLGLGMSVITESVLFYPGPGLTLDRKTWHGNEGPLTKITGSLYSCNTICGHCWKMTAMVVLVIYVLFPFMSAMIILWVVLQILLFVILFLISLHPNFETLTFQDLFNIRNLDMDIVDLKRVNNKPLFELPANPIWDILDKVKSVVKALGKRACPLIKWVDSSENPEKYQNNIDYYM